VGYATPQYIQRQAHDLAVSLLHFVRYHVAIDVQRCSKLLRDYLHFFWRVAGITIENVRAMLNGRVVRKP
jgi:hypothetical protein